MGYCPSACAGSRYRELYHDKELGRQAWASDRRRDTAGLAHSRMLRHVQERPRHGRLCAKVCGSVRAQGLASGGVAIKKLYRGWGQLCVAIWSAIQAAIWRSRALRHYVGAPRHA